MRNVLSSPPHQSQTHSVSRQTFKQTVLNAFREVEWALTVYACWHGLIEILTLLDGYRSTLSAQNADLGVKRQMFGNRTDLYLAIGGSV